MDLVVDVYELSRDFPPAEAYRLTSQVTRAVVSVPAAVPGPKVSCGAASAGVAARADIPRAAAEAPVSSAIRRFVVFVLKSPVFSRESAE